jgi:hypothetical protein
MPPKPLAAGATSAAPVGRRCPRTSMSAVVDSAQMP